MDPLLYFLCYKATVDWSAEPRKIVLIGAAVWIFVFAKSVKLMGHFVRYPVDLFMLPVSIIFGYVHGVIKLIGLITLGEVRLPAISGIHRMTDHQTDRLGQPRWRRYGRSIQDDPSACLRYR